MFVEESVARVGVGRDKPLPIISGDTLHWDGSGIAYQCVEPHTGLEPALPDIHLARLLTLSSLQARQQPVTGRHARPHVTACDICLTSSFPLLAVDWEKEAASVTFYLDPLFLVDTAHGLIPGATGDLVWVRREDNAVSISPAVHPALIVYAASDTLPTERVELVPHFQARDPLLHHIALVLQAEIEAEGVAGRLYAEALADALAIHLLRRYAASRHIVWELTGGLSPYKLRRTTDYINEHLEQALSLVELAAVGQTSPAHFARLFKHATGLAPHQYVIACRIERAKKLLTETELSLIEIGHQVGCADQSHFTALFRKHVATTPKTYRDNIKK
jgi:AraC-like DNA-binding protein